jgi:4-aminobutyrate aminotransferase-like enzyme/Ser/Thr protein kinase RdoA (MazF antagonist)
VVDNPFAALSLPTPQVSLEEAAALAFDHFGVTGPVHELGSTQEANFRVRDAAGDVVLKVANPAFASAELDLQNAVMLRLEQARLPFATPVPRPARDGSLLVAARAGGQDTHLRLLTFVPGAVLTDAAVLADPVLRSVGTLAASLGAALADVDHPAADRSLQWDPRVAADVVAALAPAVPDPVARDRIEALTARADERLAPLVGELREQVVHADLADYNLVTERGEDGRPRVSGVIDFGDVMRSWLVGDLATALTSMLWRPGRSPLLDLVQAAVGYHAVRPLRPAEVAALWPLVVTRAAVLTVSVEHQLAEDPDNQTAAGERDADWVVLDRVAAVPFDLAEQALREALGLSAGAAAVRAAGWAGRVSAAPMVPGLAQAPVLDLSVTSPGLDDGAWLDPRQALDRLAASPAAVLRHGEARLTDVPIDSPTEPASVSLGTHVLLPVGTSVVAPDDVAVVATEAGRLRLRGPDGVDLLVGGLALAADVVDGEQLAAGAPLGTVRAAAGTDSLPAHLHVQAVAAHPDDTAAVPARAQPSLAAAWLALCPDPARVLGLATTSAAPETDGEAVVHRREQVLARVQQHYYAHPPRVERGWRQYLVDARGRAYVDMVNNVTVLGHAHPAVTEAATRQYRLLNTNSRFVYDAMVRLAERITATLPDPLDTVLLVNSGSEAVDLALRLARTATGRRDVICLRGGYHGWTTATDEVSTSLQDNPHARETRPPWIHLAAMPNLYRGEFRGSDAADRYAEDVRARLGEMAEAGRAPAAFVAEPLSGNAGGVELPPGYLRQVYADVRAAGGLCIADEVQVGYGRLGTTFWGFSEHGVVPDVVTMAKAAGNGHPLGFVVTRREVAEAFASQGSFFSSVGGSPVSCAVGLAVLDTVQAEGLQANAAAVGAYLTERLGELAGRHPMVGTVHGHGLYQGVELVRDPTTREPATAEASALCERLLDLGVICQPTGDHSNVLKVKPPLCITTESADVFVDALDDALSRGW